MEKQKKVKKPRGKASLIPNKCISCGARCQSSCPVEAIEMNEKGEPIIDQGKCIGCQKCVKICPAEALEMFFTPEELEILKQLAAEKGAAGAEEEEDSEEAKLKKFLAQYKGVWVFVEQTDCTPAKVSWELLGVGAQLASALNVELCAVVLGHNVEKLCQEAFSYGASKAYLIDDPLLHHYRTATYLEGFCSLVEKYKPEVVLMGATGLGRDLAGAVATRLGTGLTADCTGLGIDEKRQLLQTRPAFGGNIMATIVCEGSRPQMATVRPRVMKAIDPDPARVAEIVRIELLPGDLDSRVELQGFRVLDEGVADIAEAEIIVSGGRGMKNPENFSLLEEIADLLGGSVGASRAAVDSGWIPYPHQVGQTGKTVQPRKYIACGISGAVQHRVGMQSSDVILAINKDETAPIFQFCSSGFVGDLFEILPALAKEIRRRRGSA